MGVRARNTGVPASWIAPKALQRNSFGAEAGGQGGLCPRCPCRCQCRSPWADQHVPRREPWQKRTVQQTPPQPLRTFTSLQSLEQRQQQQPRILQKSGQLLVCLSSEARKPRSPQTCELMSSAKTRAVCNRNGSSRHARVPELIPSCRRRRRNQTGLARCLQDPQRALCTPPPRADPLPRAIHHLPNALQVRSTCLLLPHRGSGQACPSPTLGTLLP